MPYFHVFGHGDVREYCHGVPSRVGKGVNIQWVVHDAVEIIVPICCEVESLKIFDQSWYDIVSQYPYIVVPVWSLVLVVKSDQVT